MVLQSGVFVEVKVVAFFEGCANLLVIDDVFQSAFNRLTIGDAVEKAEGDFVLRVYPFCGGGSGVVFKPTIGVFYFCSEVIVGNVLFC